jgi:transcriptional regulator with XRE-family HTH domain
VVNYTKKEQVLLYKLGAGVRRERLKAGWSQEELADIADLNRTYVGDLERGERNVAFLNLAKLAKALKCTIDDFSS